MNDATVTDNNRQGLNKEDLLHFCGTETWFRHSLITQYTYTEGVQHVAEHGGANWLIDRILINTAQHEKIRNMDFAVWELVKVKDTTAAILSCKDDDGYTVMAERIDYTDFPLDSIKMFFCDNVLLLPTEY